ncbi:AI-2E family transporter [Gimesia panareensis]|uniref:Putative inner membrane protein n=1 Tax=Gimesia panareensis TaxID=2527978 RepID=A0A517QGL6_9PLAN|nr:AI-2E family transporter [Gimesia panareensis]QDT30772.1 putative inner membrane protein [Gimesia panareensis]QDU53821.1 putative inner membrane protein [Gimesia panareensis]
MVRLVSLCIIFCLILFLGVTFFKVIMPFLLPLFLAGIVAMISQPLLNYFVKRTKGHVRIAAGITTTLIVSAILVPLCVGIFLGSLQLFTTVVNILDEANWNKTVQAVREKVEVSNVKLHQFVDWSNEYLGKVDESQGTKSGSQKAELTDEFIRKNLQATLVPIAKRSLGFAASTVGMLGSIFSALVAWIMFIIALYYFLADGYVLIESTQSLIPVHLDYQKRLIDQFQKVVRAVVLATFLAAIGQGLTTAIALYLVGFEHFIIFLILATITSMVPLLGSWLIWGPCAGWLLYQGHWGAAIFLILVGTLVVGTMDNIIRTYVLQSDAKLHPLLAFVSVLGGLQMMGLWGVFIGPIVASCLHALVQIFNTELRAFSKEKFHTDGLLDLVPDDEKAKETTDGEESQSIPESQSEADPSQAEQPAASPKQEDESPPSNDTPPNKDQSQGTSESD